MLPHVPSGVPSLNRSRAMLPELRRELRQALDQALERAEATLRQLEDELETTRAQLRATMERAETQHDDLKAANEELQSVNEEYKSMLEALATSQEELQSVNEELTAGNQELQARLQELSQATNDFHNLMAATEVATLVVDRQLRIKLSTPPLEQLFPLRPVDQERPLAHVMHRLSDGDLLRETQQVLDTLVPREREVQRDDGHTYLLRLTPYRTAEDRIDGVVLTLVDITARTQAERAVQQARDDREQRVAARTAQLAEALEALRREVAEREQAEAARRQCEAQVRQAEHFALLGRLAAGVSHELRNPLGVIVLQADILEEELRQLPPAQQAPLLPALAEITTHLARLEDIVQEYLALVRVGTVERAPVSLGAVVQACAQDRVAELAARGVTLRLEGLQQLGAVALHPSTFRRALLNLVRNALEAMPQGGTLTLRGRQTPTQVQLDIADTGVGISAAQRERMFEPLYTTKPGGTGFGLYLVRETVAAHGGAITVESTVGQGTTCTLTLPRAPAAATGQG